MLKCDLRFLSDSGSESSSDDEEEAEPQLKYERLSADLKAILKKDVASCLSVHSRLGPLLKNWKMCAIFLNLLKGNTKSGFSCWDRTGALSTCWTRWATPCRRGSCKPTPSLSIRWCPPPPSQSMSACCYWYFPGVCRPRRRILCLMLRRWSGGGDRPLQ